MDYDYKITWSDHSLEDLSSILDYLSREWTPREVNRFQEKLFNRIEMIGKYPKLFRASKIKPELRRSVLSKQTSIFYFVRTEEKMISIVRLFDNRMDTTKF